MRIDEAAARPGAPREIHGATAWAKGAVAFAQLARSVEPMLVDGAPALVWAPAGHLSRVLQFTFANGTIATVEIIADPERLCSLDIKLLYAR